MTVEESAADGLAELLLQQPRRYTSREVAGMAGVPVYRARRFWRALGFANVNEEAREFTDSDVEALVTLLRLVSEGVLHEELAVQLARSLGQAAARLAESQAELAVEALDQAGVQGGDQLRTGRGLARRLLPDLERLLVYTWRRQLAAAANRLLHVDEAGTGRLAVGFADLVGFTRLSRQLEEDELAQLVDRFESRSADVVTASGGRVVKTLGDSVLFVADAPELAAETALQLIETHAVEKAVPPLRVGLAVGSVVSRMGDVFGTTVNLASRLTAMVPPDRILVDPAMADALADDPRYGLRPVRSRAVRGLGQVAPYILSRAGGEAAGSRARVPAQRWRLRG